MNLSFILSIILISSYSSRLMSFDFCTPNIMSFTIFFDVMFLFWMSRSLLHSSRSLKQEMLMTWQRNGWRATWHFSAEYASPQSPVLFIFQLSDRVLDVHSRLLCIILLLKDLLYETKFLLVSFTQKWKIPFYSEHQPQLNKSSTEYVKNEPWTVPFWVN